MQKYLCLLSLAITMCLNSYCQNEKRIEIQTIRSSAGSSGFDMNRPDQTGYLKGGEIFFESFPDLNNWEVSNSSEPEVNWIHTSDESAIPYGDLSPFMSSSINDGFAFINANSLGQNSIQNCSLTLLEPIDLSSFSNVSIEFEQNTRNYQTNYLVNVSPDGGESWTSFEVNTEIGSNENSANPDLVRIDISEIAGNSDSVLIEFNYSANWGWHWAIDNIVIREMPLNDLSFTRAYYDQFIDFLVEDDFSDVNYLREVEYSNYQKDQVRPLSFIAQVNNLGTATQTDVTLSVDVTDPTGAITNYTSDPVDIESGVDTLLRIDDILLNAFNGGNNAEIGLFSLSYSISQNEDDQDPDNNSPIERTFRVNENFMASDLADEWALYYPAFGEGITWGSRCVFEQETEVEYISFGILSVEGAESQPGDTVFLNMRSGSVLEPENDENPVNRLFGDDELAYILSEGDFTTDDEVIWINYIFPEPVSVSPGIVYQGEVEIPSNSDNYIWMPISSQQPNNVGVLFDNSNLSSSEQGWWELEKNNPHIRLGLDFVVGTHNENSLKFKMSQNYPNPTNGVTKIDWELLEASEYVQFRISDSNGRTVYRESLGKRSAGIQESLELNLTLAAGVYQYALQIGNQIITRKMVIYNR